MFTILILFFPYIYVVNQDADNSLEMFCCRSQLKICVIISLETIFEWRPNLGSILMLEPNEAGSE